MTDPTNPDTIAAIEAAQAQVKAGNMPRKYLVCSPQTHEEIRQHFRNDPHEDGTPEIRNPDAPALNIWVPHTHVPIHVRKEWRGRRWELCDEARREEIFSVTIWRDRKHDHFWVQSGQLYESYRTARGLRFRGRGYVPGIEDIERCTDADLIRIQSVLVAS